MLSFDNVVYEWPDSELCLLAAAYWKNENLDKKIRSKHYFMVDMPGCFAMSDYLLDSSSMPIKLHGFLLNYACEDKYYELVEILLADEKFEVNYKDYDYDNYYPARIRTDGYGIETKDQLRTISVLTKSHKISHQHKKYMIFKVLQSEGKYRSSAIRKIMATVKWSKHEFEQILRGYDDSALARRIHEIPF